MGRKLLNITKYTKRNIEKDIQACSFIIGFQKTFRGAFSVTGTSLKLRAYSLVYFCTVVKQETRKANNKTKAQHKTQTLCFTHKDNNQASIIFLVTLLFEPNSERALIYCLVNHKQIQQHIPFDCVPSRKTNKKYR